MYVSNDCASQMCDLPDVQKSWAWTEEISRLVVHTLPVNKNSRCTLCAFCSFNADSLLRTAQSKKILKKDKNDVLLYWCCSWQTAKDEEYYKCAFPGVCLNENVCQLVCIGTYLFYFVSKFLKNEIFPQSAASATFSVVSSVVLESLRASERSSFDLQ